MSSKEEKKTIGTRVKKLIPNNFEEAPDEPYLESKTKIYKEKVVRNFDSLNTLGTFITIFQYVSVFVVILVLLLSRIFQGSTVSYSVLEPTYAKYLELKTDVKISNLKCDVKNDTLSYNAFSTFSYEKAVACEWVAADLLKEIPVMTDATYVLADFGENFENALYINKVLKRSLLGNTSSCKALNKTSTCRSIDNECKRGHSLVEQLIVTLGSANFPLKELVDGESKLTSFVNSTLQQNLQTLLSGLEGPKLAVEQWASENMPVIYGFLGRLHNYVQSIDLKVDDGSEFYRRIVVSCSIYNAGLLDDFDSSSPKKCEVSSIFNGRCDQGCNNPYCLYDGGSCLDAETLSYGGSNTFYDATYEKKYSGFSPLQQGSYDIVNQAYNTSKFSEELNTTLKLFRSNSTGALVFNSDEDVGTVTDSELDDYLSKFESLSSVSIWQSPANLFVGVDPEETCGNPETWYKSKETEFSQSKKSDYQQFFESFYRNAKVLISAFGGSITVPAGAVPVQNTDVYSCDALSQQQNIPGIQGFSSAEIKAWINYSYGILEWFKEHCGADANGEWRTDCPKAPIEDFWGSIINATALYFLMPDIGFSDLQIPYLEYSYLGSTARENSGSVRQLLLDAGIKRDSRGYNIATMVNFESYYKASKVSQCTYSTKIGASPATIVTVVFGLIGGVTTSASVFALVIYNVFKMRIFKNAKKNASSSTSSVATQKNDFGTNNNNNDDNV